MSYDINPATNVVTTDVLGCARCGGNHERLEFEALHRPVGVMPPPPLEPIELTHWATCPTVLQPILLRIKTMS